MKIGKIVDNPYYTGLIHRIESTIHDFDERAKVDGIVLRDSDVKSILQKVIGVLRGKTPKVPAESAKEVKLELMLSELVAFTEGHGVEDYDGKIPRGHWVLALRVVDESLKSRREMYGHSRGYLDFLKGFLEDGEVL